MRRLKAIIVLALGIGMLLMPGAGVARAQIDPEEELQHLLELHDISAVITGRVTVPNGDVNIFRRVVECGFFENVVIGGVFRKGATDTSPSVGTISQPAGGRVNFCTDQSTLEGYGTLSPTLPGDEFEGVTPIGDDVRLALVGGVFIRAGNLAIAELTVRIHFVQSDVRRDVCVRAVITATPGVDPPDIGDPSHVLVAGTAVSCGHAGGAP